MTSSIETVLSTLRSRGYEPKKSGASWASQCPAHEDQNPSLSICEGKDGRALVHCHAGCSAETIVKAIGLTLSDLMPAKDSTHSTRTFTTDPARTGQGGIQTPPGDTASVQHPRGCTLEEYATAKQLPVDFLRELGLSEIFYGGARAIRVPYLLPGGAEGPTRYRTAMTGPDRFKWKSGSKIRLYGLDR